MKNKKLPERPACIPEPEEGWVYVGSCASEYDYPMSKSIARFCYNHWDYHGWSGTCPLIDYAVKNDAPDEIWQRFGFSGNPLETQDEEDPLLKDVLSTQRQLAVQEGMFRGTRQSLSTHLSNHYGQGTPLAGNPRVQDALEHANGILQVKPDTPRNQDHLVWVLKNKEHSQFSEFRAHYVYMHDNEDGTLNVWGRDENHNILWYLKDILWFYRKDTIVHKKEIR